LPASCRRPPGPAGTSAFLPYASLAVKPPDRIPVCWTPRTSSPAWPGAAITPSASAVSDSSSAVPPPGKRLLATFPLVSVSPAPTANHGARAGAGLAYLPAARRVSLFLNVSPIPQPNYYYLPGASVDSPASQAAALVYVDSQLPPLFAALQRRGPVLCIICSD